MENVLTACRRFKQELGLPKDINCFLAGGAMVHFYLGQGQNRTNKTGDFDLFFISEQDYEKAKQYFFPLVGMGSRAETENAFTFYYQKRLVQLIKKRYGTPIEVMSGFDFTICACAYHLQEDKIYHHPRFFDDLGEKRLTLTNKKNMLRCSLHRLEKYKMMGFSTTLTKEDLCPRCELKFYCLSHATDCCPTMSG